MARKAQDPLGVTTGFTILSLVDSVQAESAEEPEHRHHIAAAVEAASHDGKTSAFVGVDYVCSFSGPRIISIDRIATYPRKNTSSSRRSIPTLN